MIDVEFTGHSVYTDGTITSIHPVKVVVSLKTTCHDKISYTVKVKLVI